MVNERFIELLTKKLSDELNENEAAELKYFLGEEECLRQYNFFTAYWAQHQGQYSNSDLMFKKIKSRIGVHESAVTMVQEETGTVKSTLGVSFFWRNIAAIFLLGLCVYALFKNDLFASKKISKTANLEATKTPSRTKSKIYLTDGTVVTLNSETVLKYPASFNGATREVYLDGEAFFDVAKDHIHPFIVHAGKMSVRVLGTAFNVKSYANDTHSETTLIRGAIEVTLSDRPSDRIILKPSEKLILNTGITKKHDIDSRKIGSAADSVNSNYALTNFTHLKSNDTTIVETSWVNNRLVFKDEVFSDLANRMERWYGTKIIFKKDAVKDYRFTGIFEKESLTQALDAMKIIEAFNYKYKNETVYIY